VSDGRKRKKKGFGGNMNVIIVDGKTHIPFHFLVGKETKIRQESSPFNI